MIKVYLASPYTQGDCAVNVKLQMDTFGELRDLGFSPFAPLMSHFIHMNKFRDYEDWLAWDFDWILACDVLFRIPSDLPSPGADREIAFAEAHGIPIVYSIKELVELVITK